MEINKTKTNKRFRLTVSHGAAFCTGESHLKYSLGYQDAHFSVHESGVFVGVICDGCSTTNNGFSRNHVGAVLGAEIIARQALRKLKAQERKRNINLTTLIDDIDLASFLVLKQIVNRLTRTSLGINREQLIDEKFLFNVTGLAIVNKTYFFFGCGDGCFGVNSKRFQISSEKGNKYFLGQMAVKNKRVKFGLFENGIISEGDTFWLASDGILPLFDTEEAQTLFFQFLHNRDVGSWASGRDQTIKTFRKLEASFNGKFNDDTTIVIAKINSNEI